MSLLSSPTTLSSQEFLDRVHAAAPRVAVFDCDGTLWSRDAGSSFMRWSIDEGLLSSEAIAWLNGRYAAYQRGEVSELAICGEMVQVYSGLRVDVLRRAAARFFREHIEPHIFPDMLQLVTDLHHAGVEIWAVSSTSDWVIEEGVQRFGIPANRVLAACVKCVDGLATTQLRDVPTDEGKVTALARVGITAPDVVFGNSVHDAAMLSLARVPFPVNPSLALAGLSAERGWPVFYPSPSPG
ncbi:MAG TPA: haloacid dehalogenase-like hydrolase [Acidobacteriaceae bacterium]|nr:haloacid dehalogenase-like hydrolase [Acidobacteriaceae bacterium]